MGNDKERGGGEPEYNVYRSRPRLFGRLRRRRAAPPPEPPAPKRRFLRRRRREQPQVELPRRRRRRWRRRFFRWAVLWALLSVVLFALSAQLQSAKLSDRARDALDGGPNLLAEPNTILVLGSDRRPEGSGEPGADTSIGRADTIMLMRVGAGKSAQLGIPRDTLAPIPGYSPQKINSAFALGGPALQIETVEQFLGIPVDHAIELDFEGFRKFIDAIGGVKVRVGHCVVSRINGGYTLRLRPGEHVLDGRQALALARTRNNECDRSEDDRTRARRQQQILAGVKDRLTDPWRIPVNFLRGPWIGWAAPQALISDMGALTMTQLVLAALAGGEAPPRVLRPSSFAAGGAMIVSDEEKRFQVERFLRG